MCIWIAQEPSLWNEDDILSKSINRLWLSLIFLTCFLSNEIQMGMFWCVTMVGWKQENREQIVIFLNFFRISILSLHTLSA